MEPSYEHGKEIGQILQELKNLNSKIDIFDMKLDQHSRGITSKFETLEKVQEEHKTFITRAKVYITILSAVFALVWGVVKDNWHRLFEK